MMNLNENINSAKVAGNLHMEYTEEVNSEYVAYKEYKILKIFAGYLFPLIPVNDDKEVNIVSFGVEKRKGKDTKDTVKIEVTNNKSNFSAVNNMRDVLSKMFDVFLYAVKEGIPVDPFGFALIITNEPLAICGIDVELSFTKATVNSNRFKDMTREEATQYGVNLFLDIFIGLNFGGMIEEDPILMMKKQLLVKFLEFKNMKQPVHVENVNPFFNNYVRPCIIR